FPARPRPVRARQRGAAAAGLGRAGERNPQTGGRHARLGRPRASARCASGDAFGRRAAARGDRAGGDRPARDPRRRRADRQRRSRPRVEAPAAVRGAQPPRHDGGRRHPRRPPAEESARFADHAPRPGAPGRPDRRPPLSAAQGGPMSQPPSPVRRNAPRFGAGDRAGIVQQSRLAGPMPWVIGIMMALTVIAAGAGLALRNLAQNSRAEIAGGVTLQILEGGPAERARQAEVAVALLSNREDVAEVRRVPDAEIEALLEPWLGEQDVPEEDAIAVPVLIDVRLVGPVTPRRLDELRAALAGSVPSARVDAQASWLEPVFDAIRSLQWLALCLVARLGASTASAVWLAARSALGSNRDTVEIIHLLGGTDGQIARLFQRSIGVDAALGGLAGLLLGLSTVVLLGRQFARLGSGMVAGGSFGPADWAMLAALPLLGIVLAMLTARLTVLSALRRML